MKNKMLLGSMLLLLSWQPLMAAEQNCLKLVFNQFCLAGDINHLMQQQPGFVGKQQQGERLGLIYADGQVNVFVLAFKSRIYKIVRRYQPATRMRFDDMKQLLENKYGPASDESRFPEDADNNAARIGAVYRGDGRMQFKWQPKPEWSVTLKWDRESGLNLNYLATDLEAEAVEALRQGL